MDQKPRFLSQTQAKSLQVLARQLIDHLELRRIVYQYRKAKESLEAIAHWQSHQVRKELASILGLLQLVNQHELSEENRECFAHLITTAQKMDQHLTNSLYRANQH